MNKFKKNKGITLVALIITIIVLLILAVVSIQAVTGDGIIAHAKNARSEYSKSQTAEQDMLSKYEYEIAKAQGTATGSYKDYLLQKEYEEAKNAGSYAGTYTEYVASKHGLGTAINTENYGKKVVGYTSKGEGLDTLVWRVFYQDNNNVYLISETSDKKSPVSNFNILNSAIKEELKKYKSGADVSVYGQALMPRASSLFTESNTNENIIATAYLCDTEVWDAYTDAEGKASYAIGSPTIELLAASYNATHSENSIELGTNTYGYTQNTSTNWFDSDFYYCSSSSMWITGPAGEHSRETADGSDMFILFSMGKNLIGQKLTDVQAYDLRPVVSIPVSEFNYTLSD